MSDITLTAGIRQNLLSLQQTSSDLTTTQEALATGKSVNSAADNPSAYFTSQNLTDTANSLSSLLDQIGQGQQTINAATDGLTGLSSLLQQALATVQQAQQASPTTAASVTAATAISGATNAATSLVIDVGTSTYTVAITASESISAIEGQINTGTSGSVTATDDGSGHLILTAASASNSLQVGSGGLATVAGLSTTAVYGQSSTRSTLQTNYNGLLSQINQLAGDATYNGVNLLTGDNLTIEFNPSGSSALTINGVNFTATGLSLSSVSGTAGGSFQNDGTLTSTIAALNDAIGQVQSQTETFGTNSGVIGTRQTFTTNLINTLQTGADNLVVADQNEESADLLTEQTQQQLEISALSIANQANQSVLKLFG